MGRVRMDWTVAIIFLKVHMHLFDIEENLKRHSLANNNNKDKGFS